jgi:hypothetical protein
MKSVKQFAASFLSAACLANSALFAAEPATAAFNPDSVVKSVEGVTLRNPASWMESYIACGNLVIRNLKVQNFSNFNNDGIDVDGGSKKDTARTPPELAANYPEGKMFGKLPAHGIYFRHVDGAVFSPSCAPIRKSNFLAVT